MIVKQVKYYNESDQQVLNNPSDLTAEQLVEGIPFLDVICNEIRINTYPGTILYINNEEIVIGEAGVYEILYEENVNIVSLRVNKDSMNYIKSHNKTYLVITFMVNES